MPCSPVGLQLFQAVDVLPQKLSQLSLYANVLFYEGLKLALLVLGKILGELLGVDLGLGEYLRASGQTDTINVSKRVLDLFLVGNVYTE